MRTIKDTKGIHNRTPHGSWGVYGNKEERKRQRKLFKSVRHKLQMCAPLTDEEEAFRQTWAIEKDSKMSCTGFPLVVSWKRRNLYTKRQ